MVQWNAAKTRVQLRLAVQRLRMLQEKKTAQAKSSRRDIATLVERGRLETARIKVENIINEDIYVELLELLELYCELLIARFNFLEISGKEPDPGIYEAVCCLIYASPRTELKELHILREMLMYKFGRDFSLAVMENRDNCVSERVTRKLAVAAPDANLIEAYVEEIARGYGIEYVPRSSREKDNGPSSSEEGDQPEGKVPSSSVIDENAKKTEETPEEEVQSKLDANVTASKLPTVPGAPPPTKDKDIRNVSPQPPPYVPSEKPLKPALKKNDSTSSTGESNKPPPAGDDFVSLTERLAALKRR